MKKVLLLTHRIPFPPDKGDKIRSYHLLLHLARRHEIYLGSFIDDPADHQYRQKLQDLCAEVKLITVKPTLQRVRSLSGLVNGEALSVAFYRFAEMADWVDQMISVRGVSHAVAFSSPMAQYLSGDRHGGMMRIADFCDVDSDKWRQYAKRKRLPMKWIYAREALKLLAFERRMARELDSVLFVSQAEADLFRTLAPEAADQVGHFDNGVDIEYFNPARVFASPYGSTAGPIAVFTGAMDYWANIDAVVWFAEAIWPMIQMRSPASSFWIVGSNPDRRVQALERFPGLRVTGRVSDVRPYLAHADVAVAPLRIARGTQNKVLEALAMALPVVSTPAAAAGLRLPSSAAFHTKSDPAAFAQAVLQSFEYGSNLEGRAAVAARYNWEANLSTIDTLLAPESDALAVGHYVT